MENSHKPSSTRPSNSSKSDLILQARAALNGEARTSQELKDLYKKLEAVDQFDYASELLKKRIEQDRANGVKVQLEDAQRLAKYIYKDNSLSSQFKFDRALQELNAADTLEDSDNCETLGLAGAIYKRKWQFDHQFKNLALSRYYYKRGFDLWKRFLGDRNALNEKHTHNDEGWNAINYAFVLELEAINELEEIGAVTGFRNFNLSGLSEAQETRKYILVQFVEDPFGKPQLRSNEYNPWVIATIAEAYFGLCRYKEANEFIRLYKNSVKSQPWELRTFGQQIFSIAYLQQIRDKLTKGIVPRIVFEMPGETGTFDEAQIKSCLNALSIEGGSEKEIKNDGKTGLALSGGGFRASLFHIGALAALAERDELRSIEVISCVSGGSIIGAYYYLKLKLLLEEKRDEDITREDYINLVKETESGFLKGVQKNLRMRMFSNLISNFKMFSKDYSRTNRMGELYENHLFKPIFQEHINKQKEKAKKEGRDYVVSRYEEFTQKHRSICMGDLFITPDEDFVLIDDNWKRMNKIPQLILNATSVNTGHNWQFTASWMGEPAAGIIADIDVKSRLRRMYYADAPPPYPAFRLGYAVGASSCVPVMFEPLPMNNLYPGFDLQLVDGGLHDNQGIASILEQECKNVFISDASGQLPTESKDVAGVLPVFMRSDNILQERLRELQFMDMKERKNTTLVNRLVSVHLKNGITTPSVNWKNCTDPARTISYADPRIKDESLMAYGVLRSSQQLISEIRTDLDAFHDTEAFALMYDGYAQMHYELSHAEGGPAKIPENGGWRFLDIRDDIRDPARAETINKKLKVSSRVPLKLYYLLSKPMRILALIVTLSLVALLLIQLYKCIPANFRISTRKTVFALLVLVIGIYFKPAAIILNPKGYVSKILGRIATAILGWVTFNFYLIFFNGLYLRLGKLKRK